MNESHLAGQHLRHLLASHARQISEGAYEIEQNLPEIKETIDLVEALFPAWVTLLCMVQHPRLMHVSQNSTHVTGYTPDQLQQIGVENYFDLIHPDDMVAVRQSYGRMREITLSPGYDPKQHRFVFHYRLRRPDGQYMYLLDDKLAVQNHHNRYVFFTLFRDQGQERKFTRVLLEIHRYQPGDQTLVEEYVPEAAQPPITAREKEVLDLLQKGLNSPEISHLLTISVHTVKNHRHNLLRKANARNSVELLHYAQQAKWL
jgi:DNA-binding CsgD family transcriptional regulator